MNLDNTSVNRRPARVVRAHLRHFLFGLTVSLLVSLASCHPPVDPAYNLLLNMPAESTINADVLGPEDVIVVRVYEDKSLNGEFVVSAAGTINFPLLGKVAASGLTCAELEDELRGKLIDGYIADPTVTCNITEANSKKIIVLGEVKKPGAFRYENDMRVVQAVSAAGGLSRLAAPSNTVITRSVGGEIVKARVPLEEILAGQIENLRLQPGDVIFVPASAI